MEPVLEVDALEDTVVLRMTVGDTEVEMEFSPEQAREIAADILERAAEISLGVS